MHHFYHVGILVCDDWIMSSKAVSTEHSSFLVISFRSQHRVLCTKYRGAASSSRSRRSLRPPPMPTGDTRWFLPPKKSPPSLLNPLLPCKKMGVWEGLETFGDPPKCGWVSFNFSLIKINLTLKEKHEKNPQDPLRSLDRFSKGTMLAGENYTYEKIEMTNWIEQTFKRRRKVRFSLKYCVSN